MLGWRTGISSQHSSRIATSTLASGVASRVSAMGDTSPSAGTAAPPLALTRTRCNARDREQGMAQVQRKRVVETEGTLPDGREVKRVVETERVVASGTETRAGETGHGVSTVLIVALRCCSSPSWRFGIIISRKGMCRLKR
jgi:hypothetical protein